MYTSTDRPPPQAQTADIGIYRDESKPLFAAYGMALPSIFLAISIGI
jgi:hypothetical protein